MFRLLTVCVGGGGLTACQHLGPLTPAQYAHTREHSVLVGQDGHALLPDTLAKARVLRPADSLAYARYIGGIMEAVRRSGKSEIMLRIHGGMNSLEEQVDTNLSITNAIAADSGPGSTAYYPLYLDWESSLARSYVDHLLFVRQGHSYRGGNPLGWGLAPFYLLADVGRAVTAAPILWKTQVTAFWGTGASKAERLSRDSLWTRGAPGTSGSVAKPCDRSPENAELPRVDPDQVALELCPFLPTNWETFVDRSVVLLAPLPLLPTLPYPRHWSGGEAKYFSTRPPTRVFGGRVKLFSPWMAAHVSVLRVPIAPFAVLAADAVGRPGYSNMRRRTKTMFHDANEFTIEARRSLSGTRYAKPTGALPRFLDSLTALVLGSMPSAGDSLALCWGSVARDTSIHATTPYRVTLIGHSMGAIIAGDILRTCPALPVANVVYMAAAATVAEVERDVLPYLGAHRDARFYNVTLHPKADRRETLPRQSYLIHGSLLTWLDGFLSNPETDHDRMIGRFENAIAALHVIPDSVRGQMYLKGFGYRGEQSRFYPAGQPYKHRHFGDARFRFWRCDFWTPSTALRDCAAAP